MSNSGVVVDPQAPRPQPAARFPALQTARQKRWKRYEKQLPGHQVRSMSNSLRPRPRPCWPSAGAPSTTSSPRSTTAPDCAGVSTHATKTAIQFVDYVLERLPFPRDHPDRDNGAEFQEAFHYHCVLDKGVSHHYIKPRTPRLTESERSQSNDQNLWMALGLVT